VGLKQNKINIVKYNNTGTCTGASVVK